MRPTRAVRSGESNRAECDSKGQLIACSERYELKVARYT